MTSDQHRHVKSQDIGLARSGILAPSRELALRARIFACAQCKAQWLNATEDIPQRMVSEAIATGFDQQEASDDEAVTAFRDATREYAGKETPAALIELGQLAWDAGKHDASRQYFERALTASERVWDSLATATCLSWLAKAAERSGEPDDAKPLLRRAFKLYEAITDVRGAADCDARLGDLAERSGDTPTAVQHWEHALTLYRSLPDPDGIARCLRSLSHASQEDTDWANIDTKSFGLGMSLIRDALKALKEFQPVQLFSRSIREIGEQLRSGPAKTPAGMPARADQETVRFWHRDEQPAPPWLGAGPVRYDVWLLDVREAGRLRRQFRCTLTAGGKAVAGQRVALRVDTHTEVEGRTNERGEVRFSIVGGTWLAGQKDLEGDDRGVETLQINLLPPLG